jgi:hypothetical protein
LAAPVILAALKQNEIDLRPYEQAVDAELMPDLLTARIWGFPLISWPGPAWAG